MFCKICGTQNDANAAHCVRCGTSLAPTAPPPAGAPWQNPAAGVPPQPQGYYPPQQQPQYPPQGQMPPYGMPVNRPANIENYFVQSILVTILCCLPLGVAAIVKSRDVDKMLAMGNLEGAMAASKTTKTLCFASAGVSLGLGIIFFLVSLASNH